jgi:insecticidal toxin complex protein TccC
MPELLQADLARAQDVRSPLAVTPSRPALPAGGGALRGIGESFGPNEFSGAASISVPIATAAARGFEPQLALGYSSGGGNGPFGLGWDIGLPSIARSTARRIPRYDDSDTFVLGGARLVPLDRGRRSERLDDGPYEVTAYAPRLQQSFDRIERWRNAGTGETFWRIRDRDNAVREFGRTAQARIVDSDDPSRVFRWLVETELDADGNCVSIEYRQEDLAGVADAIYERGRVQTAQRYVSRIRYANATPCDGPPSPGMEWHFELVFDYGDYDPSPSNPDPYRPVRPWAARADPFSEYAAGFEIRTHRLCRGVLLFHRFDELGPRPVLTHLTRLVHEQSPRCALLTRIDSVGYRRQGGPAPAEPYRSLPLPPLEFGYTAFDPLGHDFEPLRDVEGRDLPGVGQPPLYSLADLDGEGVPGVLYGDGRSVLYWAPELAPPGAPLRGFGYAPPRVPSSFPLQLPSAGRVARLVDLSGNGRLDLLVEEPVPGFYPHRADGGWGPFTPLASVPATLFDPAQDTVDLTGDGLADLIQIGQRGLRFWRSLGTRGYGPPVALDEQALPQTGMQSAGRWVGFADVFGSGQQHLVRIRDGIIECWPNVGYGRFGRRVLLGNAPALNGFAPGRLLFSDVDGSGTADLLVIEPGHVRVYMNQSGNTLAPAVRLPLPLEVGSPAQVQTADLRGTGTEGLVVSALQPPRHWSYDWSGGAKPYLLSTIRNNIGAQTEIRYASSARFYLEDKLAGRPWITSLPFPVQVIERVIQRDLISDVTLRRTFRYHHGYYDPDEREFRGFGMVERADAEVFGPTAPEARDGSDPLRPPATLTRTWYHTGAWREERQLEDAYRREYFRGDPDAYRMPGPAFDWNGFGAPEARTLREAYAALHGTVLRHEIYGLDSSALAGVPYEVSAASPLVRLLQPAGEDRPAVFHLSQRESIDYDYARDAHDPRVTHGYTLEQDPYGDETLSARLAYPRRDGSPDAIPEQREPHLTAQRSTYLDLDGPGALLLGIPSQVEEFEIEGFAVQPGTYAGFAEALAAVRSALDGPGPEPEPGPLSARRTGWARFYYAAVGGGEAPPGQITPQALLLRSERAAMEASELAALLAPVIDAENLRALLEQRGPYALDPANGYWWRPTPRGAFLGASGFFSAASIVEPLGGTTTYSYDAGYIAMVGARTESSGILPHVTRATGFDYQSMLPDQVLDVNGNTSEVLLDPLAMVAVASHYGTQDAHPVGFDPILGVDWPQPHDAAELIGDPGRFLRGAATFYFHDLLSFAGVARRDMFSGVVDDVEALWQALVERAVVTPEGVLLGGFHRLERDTELGLPEAVRAAQAEIFSRLRALPAAIPAHTVQLIAPAYPADGRPPANDEIPIEVQYFDGFGRVVQDKRRVEPGPSFTVDAAGAPATDGAGTLRSTLAAERWVTSARVRYNDKGKPVRQYEPYFVDTWRYTPYEALDSIGYAYTLSYDALNRVVRVDTPKGFFRTQRYGAWSETYSDEDDTVLDSDYYRTHIDDPGLDRWERQALLKSALSYDTPSTTVLDNLARPVRGIERDNGIVPAGAFEPLGFTAEQSAQIRGELRTNGFLDARAAPTIAYQPGRPGFDLRLRPPYEARQQDIIAALDAIRAAGTALVTRSAFDIAGRELWSTDPRLWAIWESEGGHGEPPRNFRTTYGTDGDELLVRSADRGELYQLMTANGSPLFCVDGRGLVFDTYYDAALRPTRVHVSGGQGAPVDRDLERRRYGDELTPSGPLVPDPGQYNLIGEVLELDSPDLLTLTPSYSILGDPLRQTLTFRSLTGVTGTGQGEIGDPVEDEAFDRSCEYDALGRVVASTDSDGNRLLSSWLVSSYLGALKLVTAAGAEHPYVTRIGYNARGQREAVEYLGGVVSRTLEYDPATTALRHARATGADGQTLQDARYYADAAGNPTHVTDSAFDALFGRFGPASAELDYTTDALYRLVAASARQHADYGPADERQGGYDGLVIDLAAAPSPLIEDVSLAFAPDAAGSIYWHASEAAPGSWQRALAFSDRSNRAIETAPAAGAAQFAPPEEVRPAATVDRSFDGNGNQVAVDGLDAVRWDERNLLVAVRAADRQEIESYGYDAVGRRVRRLVPGVEDVLYLGDFEVHRDLATGAVRQVARVIDAGEAVAEYSRVSPSGSQDSRLVLADRLASVVLELDEGGSLLDYEEYLPFGATAWAAVAEPGAIDRKQYRFAGSERDRASGLYVYGQRCYAPWLARWLSPDPAGAVDGLNLYRYAGANPVRYVDVAGNVKVDISGGTVDISLAEITTAVKAAGSQLRATYSATTLTPKAVSKKRKFDTYEAASQGDLFALSFNPGLRGRGAIRPFLPVTPFYLQHGTVESSLHKMREVGVHGTKTLKNPTYKTKGQYGMPSYPDMERVSTRNEEKQAARTMIRQMKVKEVAIGGSFNNRIVPVMAISENDRSEVGGLLAMIELYNVKYGKHTMFDAFQAGTPYFIGAEVDGGAKALKNIDRGERLIGRQQTKLEASLTAFVEELNAKGKFSGAMNVTGVQNIITALLVKRGGPAAAPSVTTTVVTAPVVATPMPVTPPPTAAAGGSPAKKIKLAPGST